MTASMRFGGNQINDLSKILTNILMYPRLHHFVPSMGAFCPDEEAYTTNKSIFDITRSVYSSENALLGCDFSHGFHVSNSLVF